MLYWSRIITTFHLPIRVLSLLCALIVVLCSSALAHAAARAGGAQAGALSIKNVQVSHDTFLAHSEPDIAENPSNHENLIAGSKMFTNIRRYEFKIGAYYSKDGGKTWHDDGLLPGFDAYATTSDISFAFSSTGVAYACVLALQDNTSLGYKSGVFVLRSTDGGVTWSAPVQVFLDTTGDTFSDKPWIAVDQSHGPTAGNVYVAWNLDSNSASNGDPDSAGPDGVIWHQQLSSDTPTGIAVARSTDGGSTFSLPTIVAPFNQEFYIGAIPAVSPNGQLSVIFGAIPNQTAIVSSVDIVTSRDGGKTFTPLHVVSKVVGLPNHLSHGTFRNLSLPAFVISPFDGSMVVAWSDLRNGDADILESASRDGGITWSAPVRVNHDRLGNKKDQFQPALAAAPNGTVTCAWFDRRWDPSDTRIDEAIAQSMNDGRSFGKNFRVTRHSWDPSIDAPEPEGKSDNTFIGDYQALAADNQTVHPLWNDTQNGLSQQIRTAVISVRIFARR